DLSGRRHRNTNNSTKRNHPIVSSLFPTGEDLAPRCTPQVHVDDDFAFTPGKSVGRLKKPVSIDSLCKHECKESKQLQANGEDNEKEDRLPVKDSHHPTAEKPGHAETSIEQTKTRGSDVTAKQRGDDGFQERILGAHADSPKNHSAKGNPGLTEKDERRKKGGNEEDGDQDRLTSFIKPLSENEGTY